MFTVVKWVHLSLIAHSYSIMASFCNVIKKYFIYLIHQGISSSLWQAMIVNLTAHDTLVIWYCRPVWITWVQLCLFYILTAERKVHVCKIWYEKKKKKYSTAHGVRLIFFFSKTVSKNTYYKRQHLKWWRYTFHPLKENICTSTIT